MYNIIRKVINGVNYKKCSKCGRWLPYDDFAKCTSNQIDQRQNHCKDCHKKYYSRNKDRIIQCSRQWKQINHEQNTQYQRDYFKANPIKRKTYFDTWCKNHPEAFRTLHKQYNYSRRIHNNSHTITKDAWQALCKELNYCCAYCGVQFSPNELTMDHVVPLSQGGVHDISNILPACLSCNCSKQSKSLEEFLLLRGEPIE